MRRALDALYAAAQGVAIALLLAVAILVLVQMGSRIALVVVPGVDDYAGYCLAGATFMGLAPTFRAGAHIRVTMISNLVGPGIARALDLAVLAIGLAFAIYFTVAALDFVRDSYELQEVATGMVATPLWIPRLLLPLGLAILVPAIIEEIVAVARGRAEIGSAAARARERRHADAVASGSP